MPPAQTQLGRCSGQPLPLHYVAHLASALSHTQSLQPEHLHNVLLCCCCHPQNLNWVWPLQRQEFTLVALINTGSLWLYEGPRSQSPGPLLVARLISRGIASMALPDNFLVQPLQLDSSSPPQLLPPSFQCGKLDAGAMRPPGFWDGGVRSMHALRLMFGV